MVMDNSVRAGNAVLIGNQHVKERDYWMGKLSGELVKSYIVYDYNKSASNEYLPGRIDFKLHEHICSRILKISGGVDSKILMIVTAAVTALIQKYTQNDDIIVGMPIFKQKQDANFINTVIAVRNVLKKNTTFKELIILVRKTITEACENQNYPIEALLYQLKIPFLEGECPLFDIAVLLENVQDKRYISHVKSNITFSFTRNNEAIEGFIEYNTALYMRSTVESLLEHLINLFYDALENIEIPICNLTMLSSEEKRKLMVDFNDTSVKYGWPKTIHKLFEEQVELTPGNTAVIFEDRQMSYGELNEKANILAKLLISKGVRPDSAVAVIMDRSIEMIVGVMGILKAGGAYVPIDCEYPSERIDFILKDCSAGILLTRGGMVKNDRFSGEIIELDQENLYYGDGTNIGETSRTENMAYIIYTSGSTGYPKGVVVEHRSIFNTLAWRKNCYNFDCRDTVLQIPSFAFDSSVEDIFTPLISGSCLVMIKQEKRNELEYLRSMINKFKVTHFLITPRLYKAFLEDIHQDLKGLKNVTIAGDSFTENLVKEHLKKLPHVALYNEYGPTENSVCSTVYKFESCDINVLIGKPISNVKCYVVDRNMNLCPVGIPGELCVSGPGLARGYLNLQQLTMEKFVPSPFIDGERLYLTGDVARWLDDGNLEFIGRTDHQVKIRGFRIELGEIESQLLMYEMIKEALVITYEDKQGNKSLCAYYVADAKLSSSELRRRLEPELPDYMIPSYFVYLDKIPLTSNGKVDMQALPRPESVIDTEEEYVGPRDEVEEMIREVCLQVLGVDRMGIHDNFFKLGGDSIKVIQITARLLKYNIKVETKDLFKYPTIAQLRGNVKIQTHQAEQGVVTGEVELTPVQRWFFEKRFKGANYWNQAVLLHGRFGFESGLVEKVFSCIVCHHDALRMCYRIDGDNIIQFNRDIDGRLFDLCEVDLKDCKDYVPALEAEAVKVQKSINLDSGPMVKLALFKTVEGDYLLIVIHHLVVDAISWRIILEDFAVAYTQSLQGKEIELPLKTDSFKDWSRQLKSFAGSSEFLKEAVYWNKLEKPQMPELPRDGNASCNVNSYGEDIKGFLSQEQTDNLLKYVNSAYNTAVGDILLTALGMAVKEWTGFNQVLLNLEGHGREDVVGDINITRTVGWFTSDYPIILDMSKSHDIPFIIKYVKEYLRSIPNKGIGYGILKYLTEDHHKSMPEFNYNTEIAFNYLGQFDQDIDGSLFSVSSLPIGELMNPDAERLFRIEVNSMVINGRFEYVISYNKEEYKMDTITKLRDLFMKYILDIMDHCMKKEESEFTPSDLGGTNVSIEEFENILDAIENIG